MFPIELWNVHSRIKNYLPRTNNFSESWNKAFSSVLRSHPSVYALIDAFRKEQKRTEDNIIKLQTGCIHKRKPKYEQLDERLNNVMDGYTKQNYKDIFDSLNLLL